MTAHPGLAVVLIGRNEGERLRRCIASVAGQAAVVVYVDSGSTDGSLEMAEGHGVHTVALDMTLPFTAARARNAGFARALAIAPALRWVQFVDGDCEVDPDWLTKGIAHLTNNPQLAVVCGRRRERNPHGSIYNLLCDIEWNVPAGPARSCGGDAMLRATALQAQHGYREDLIAGEEPELCVRLRAAGWQVHVLQARMTLHDAAMTRFAQWWLRSVRAGYAFAAGAALHGAPPERHGVREVRRAIAWACALPAATFAAALAGGPWGLLLLLAYPAQFARLVWAADGPLRTRALRAGFLLIGKFAELQGVIRFCRLRLHGRNATLIEYK